jgi:exosortase H (IPTLxxWG-CTERM-specific)
MSGQKNIRFAVTMTGFTLVLLLLYREAVLGGILSSFTDATARTTLWLLHMCGIEAARTATMIYHPDGFAYEIYYRCTGFLPAALLTASIFAYPGLYRSKLCGWLLGVPALLSVNLLRLVGLFGVGVYAPDAFNFAHSVAGNGLMVLATLAIWLAWVKWASRTNASSAILSSTIAPC